MDRVFEARLRAASVPELLAIRAAADGRVDEARARLGSLEAEARRALASKRAELEQASAKLLKDLQTGGARPRPCAGTRFVCARAASLSPFAGDGVLAAANLQPADPRTRKPVQTLNIYLIP